MPNKANSKLTIQLELVSPKVNYNPPHKESRIFLNKNHYSNISQKEGSFHQHTPKNQKIILSKGVSTNKINSIRRNREILATKEEVRIILGIDLITIQLQTL